MGIDYSTSAPCWINNYNANFAKVNSLIQKILNYLKSKYFLIGFGYYFVGVKTNAVEYYT